MKTQARGFTLIELMIVVSIIAVLAAIALPILARNQARAAESACLAEMKGYVSMSIAAIASDDPLQAAPRQACSTADTITAESTTVTGTPKSPGARQAICGMTTATCQLQ